MISHFYNLKIMNKVFNGWYTVSLRSKIAPPTLSLPSWSNYDSDSDIESELNEIYDTLYKQTLLTKGFVWLQQYMTHKRKAKAKKQRQVQKQKRVDQARHEVMVNNLEK